MEESIKQWKTNILCPFCKEFHLCYDREIYTDTKYHCVLRCRNCGLELKGEKLLVRKKITKPDKRFLKKSARRD